MWNVLAIVVALIGGSIVNMLLVTVGPVLIPPPAGVDVADMASLAASIHLFEAKHFVFPFLAHALGTLTGAMIAVMISHRSWSAWLVGLLFLVGGIAVSFMIPAPVWFTALDLIVAYLPMAWLGLFICRKSVNS